MCHGQAEKACGLESGLDNRDLISVDLSVQSAESVLWRLRSWISREPRAAFPSESGPKRVRCGSCWPVLQVFDVRDDDL